MALRTFLEMKFMASVFPLPIDGRQRASIMRLLATTIQARTLLYMADEEEEDAIWSF